MQALNKIKPANQINLSVEIIEVVNATANLPIASNILIYAKADIFSWATIAAVYGILNRERQNDNTEN